MLITYFITEFDWLSKSELCCVTTRVNFLNEVWRRVIYGMLRHSIVHTWSGPFPGLWVVAGLCGHISIGCLGGSFFCLKMHWASPIDVTPSSFYIDRSSTCKLSLIFLSTNVGAWILAESVEIPALMRYHSQSSGFINPVHSAILLFYR